MSTFLILLFATGLLGYLTDNVDADCRSINHTYVKDGTSFTPEGADDCMTCLCKNSEPVYCNMLECTPPSNEECKNYVQLDGCCEYACRVPEDNGSNQELD